MQAAGSGDVLQARIHKGEVIYELQQMYGRGQRAIVPYALMGGPTSPWRFRIDTIYTPPAGGVVYVIGAGFATVSNKYLPQADYVHEATTGTMEMNRRLRQKEEQKRPAFALFATPDAPRAFKGEGEYGGKAFTGLRTVAYVNSSDIYFVVPANSPIKSYADVKGKRIGVGSAGSTISNSAFFFLEQYGIKRTDFKVGLYNYKEVVEGIQNGSLDGGFLGGSYPMPRTRSSRSSTMSG